jgi:hypothetical protein
MSKIYITGCAKSGTTMLNNLMTAFDLKVVPGECYLTALVQSDFDCGKRDWNFLFSKDVPYINLISQYNYIIKNEVKILNINRKKKDVLASENGYVSEKRYDACQEHKKFWGDAITCDVWFEDILDDPLGMQYTVAMYLGLYDDRIVHKWTDYPDFVPQSFWDHWKDAGPRYQPRKLGEKV